MHKSKASRWVWYAVLVAVVVGLFTPTMVAFAAKPIEPVSRCPIPKA